MLYFISIEMSFEIPTNFTEIRPCCGESYQPPPDSHDTFSVINCKGLVCLSQMVVFMASVKKKNPKNS